jgi:RNA polymerase sigma-70 factor (ECF subfamily)
MESADVLCPTSKIRVCAVVVKADLKKEMDHKPSGSNDGELVYQAAAGNADAFEEVLKKYQRYVLNVVKKHVPYNQVEDLAQEVFIRIYESLPPAKFQGEKKFEHWISTIAVRTCYDFWRKQYKSRELPISSLTENQQVWLEEALSEASAKSFYEKGLEKEAKELLDWALGRLSAEERMVVELVHLEGCSVKEAARLLGWSSVNVKVRSFRSRKKLRRLLDRGLKEGRGSK